MDTAKSSKSGISRKRPLRDGNAVGGSIGPVDTKKTNEAVRHHTDRGMKYNALEDEEK